MYEVCLRKILNKVDITEFNRFKTSQITFNEFESVKNKQYAMETRVETLQREIVKLKEATKNLTENVQGKFDLNLFSKKF